MSFFLEYTPQKATFNIHHGQAILLFGSCFNNNLEAYFLQHGFVTINAYKTVFNPVSIARQIQMAISGQTADTEIFQDEGKYFSYDFSTAFVRNTLNNAREALNAAVKTVNRGLQSSDPVIIITLGSAWVYEHKGNIVANCHKQKQHMFKKRMLSVLEIKEALSIVLKQLRGAKVVFTLSPVRHIKDGLSENLLSKSSLRLAIDSLISKHHNAYYFPAYEIVIDQLRDYRFFKKDLIHPNEIAVEYVWKNFAQVFFNQNTQRLVKEIKQLFLATHHKSSYLNTQLERNRLEELMNRIKALESKENIHTNLEEKVKTSLRQLMKH